MNSILHNWPKNFEIALILMLFMLKTQGGSRDLSFQLRTRQPIICPPTTTNSEMCLTPGGLVGVHN